MYQKCYKCDGSIRVKEKHRGKVGFLYTYLVSWPLKKEKKDNAWGTPRHTYVKMTHIKLIFFKDNSKAIKMLLQNPELHGVFYEGV